ncbi:MAG: hypothetical protein HYZ63_03895, partial [Candidatus Andersenbacteria bacterium]|nr:hypothetical protein [Candidatus Andersenbacteria bacterium]
MATTKDVFQEHLEGYLKATKGQKGAILTHVCFVAGLHRKAAVRKFKYLQMRHGSFVDRRG